MPPLLLARAALCAAALFASAAHAQAPPAATAAALRPRVEPHELWVLELRLGGRVLAEGVLAIDREGELLLPLGELAAAFDLAVEVDVDRARAEGWLIHPDRDFALDLAHRELLVEDAPINVAPAHIILWSEDIYVDARSLSAWWPVDLEVDRRTLRIEAISREALPVEQRFARDRLHDRLGLSRPDAPAGASEASEYRWWGVPALDVNLLARALRPPEGGGHDFESQYDMAAAGDLLRLHSEMLWTGVTGDYSRLRARAGRRDYEGHMGGPLHLREFTLGDVATPSLANLSQTRGGRGFQVSSFPLHYLNELGQLTLEGDLRPGCDVEVYRDDVLLDFQGSSSELRYRFEDLPTIPGLNVFRLVFHGPRGEARAEERRVWMDGGLAPPGETRFRVTANQHESDLLAFGGVEDDEELHGELRGIGEIEHGFGERLTLAFGAASLPLREGRQHYATAGARTQLWGSLLRADLLGSHEGGFGGGAAWQTRLGRTALGLSHHEFRDFLSERTRIRGGEDLLGRSEANLDGSAAVPALPLHYRVGLGASRLRGGDFDTDGLLRLSTWLSPVWLTHTLRAQIDRSEGTGQRTIDGDLLASFRRGALGRRGRLAYAANPADLQHVALLADWSPRVLTSTHLGVIHAFGERTSLFAAISRRVGALVLSASVAVDDDGLAQAGLGVSFGLTPDPYRGGLHAQQPGATRNGAVSARAFLDRNANGAYDPGDEPLPGIAFRARGNGGAQSGREGTALLTQLPVDQPVEVAIDAGTLDDPHWLAPRESERVVLRPGTPVPLDFPVVPVGEIDGWVSLVKPEGSEPVAGASLQLLDASGDIAASARSEIDGFYVLPEIAPGAYRLRVDPDQAKRAGWIAPLDREVVISGAGSIVSDADLELRLR